MTVTVVMLYPHPRDPGEFDEHYVNEHLPLMRELVGPDVQLPTYKTVQVGADPAPYYRVAEIHFPTRAAFDEFVSSGRSQVGRRSSQALSTGGPPVALVCERRDEAPA